jgi:hypothetical protein
MHTFARGSAYRDSEYRHECCRGDERIPLTWL